MCADKRPNMRDILKNLRQPMPLGEKLRLFAGNMKARLAKRQACCGHPGQPGC